MCLVTTYAEHKDSLVVCGMEKLSKQLTLLFSACLLVQLM